MKRFSGMFMILVIMMFLALAGCEDDSQAVAETGFELVTEGCLSFGVYVFIDGELQDFASTDEPHLFPLPPGTYDFYAYGNAVIGGSYACWSDTTVTVGESEVSQFIIRCNDANQCN